MPVEPGQGVVPGVRGATGHDDDLVAVVGPGVDRLDGTFDRLDGGQSLRLVGDAQELGELLGRQVERDGEVVRVDGVELDLAVEVPLEHVEEHQAGLAEHVVEVHIDA